MMEEQYVIHGPEPVVPLSLDSFGTQLYDSFLKNRKLPSALVDAVTGQNLSYQEVLDKSRNLALNLQKHDIKQNDVIAIYSGNSLDFVCPVIAAMYLGIAATTINPNYTSRELIYCTSVSKPVVIFCSEKTLKVASEAGEEMEFLRKIVVMDTKEKCNGFDSIETLTSNCSKEELENFTPVTIDPSEHVGLILYSSGTTGLPKGVSLTHKNISTSLSVYRIRELWLVPPLVHFLGTSSLIGEYDLSSIEMVFYGGAYTSLDIVEEIKKRLKLKTCIQGYGLTETSGAISFSPTEEDRVGSCGKLLPRISAKVICLDSVVSLGPQLHGELCFKGDQIMKGYAGNVGATKEIIDEDGWLHTGDIGYYDEDGFLFVVDRLKELIKYKGFQVAPTELETLLLTHPEIQEVCVVGLPDETAGELPLAFVVRKPSSEVTEETIKNFLASKVSPQKQLRGGVRFVDAIPKNPTGKILRRKIRELL